MFAVIYGHLKNLFSHFSENLLFGSSDYETQKTKNEAD